MPNVPFLSLLGLLKILSSDFLGIVSVLLFIFSYFSFSVDFSFVSYLVLTIECLLIHRGILKYWFKWYYLPLRTSLLLSDNKLMEDCAFLLRYFFSIFDIFLEEEYLGCTFGVYFRLRIEYSQYLFLCCLGLGGIYE